MRTTTKQAETILAFAVREQVRTQHPELSLDESEAVVGELLERARPGLLDIDAMLAEWNVDED